MQCNRSVCTLASVFQMEGKVCRIAIPLYFDNSLQMIGRYDEFPEIVS